MTLRRKFLFRIFTLSFLIIFAMSGTYYVLFTRDIRERSHQNVEMTFNLILDDISTRVTTVSSKIDEFIQSALASPMYTVQLLQTQQDPSDKDAVFWTVKRSMTYLHILTSNMREFGTLAEATEILVYGIQGNLVATYREEADTETTAVYFPAIWHDMMIPIQPDDRWFATMQTLDDVPLQPVPQQLVLIDQEPVPEHRTLQLTNRGNRVMIQFRVPIVERGNVQGVCVLNMAIRQQDVERYAQLSGTEVNVFAGTTLSVGSLPDYNVFPDEHSLLRQSSEWLSTTIRPETTFSDIKVRDNSYYQGGLAIGDTDTLVGVVSVLFPRSLEEQQKRYFLVIVALVTLGFSILVVVEAFGLSRAIGIPLSHLMTAMQRMKSGDLDVRAPVETNDEIGRLAQTFNTMSAQLKQSIAQIEEHRQEVERQYRELQRLDKLKDEFLANTSHELRTPLNGISGLAEAILSGADGPLTEDEGRHVRMILQSSTRLTNLVNSLLDYSKVKSEQIQLRIVQFPLSEVTDVVCAFARELANDKPIELRADLPDDVPEVYADIDRVEQILTNLVGNAVKFTQHGSIVISTEQDGDWLRIAVQDTGIGIPEQALTRIFNPFEQADGSITREYGGTGLGLAITKELVELHGGQIWVESQAGQGSTFYITLPCTPHAISNIPVRAEAQSSTTLMPATLQTSASEQVPETLGDEAEASIRRRKTKSAKIAGQGHTVLVIDEDPTYTAMLRTYLTEAGFTALTATNRPEAVELITGYEVDVILCDVMLSMVEGYTFAMRMREQDALRDIPLMFVSARDQKQDAVNGYALGDELLLRIQALVGARQRTRKTRYVTPVYDIDQEKDEQYTNIRQGNGETVLVVDDEPINIEVLKSQLGQHGYQVMTAVNGPDALEIIEHERPDLVLLDLMMPKMSGFRVCQILRQEKQLWDLPIIMLTAKSNIYDRVYGLNIGANDYVVKPFHLDELLTRIYVLLDIANLQQELLQTNTSLRAEVSERTQAEEALRVEVLERQKTAEELRDVNEKLARLNDELEQRVAERTTELQTSLNRLKATQRQLVQSEKMAALGGLVAGIAHEMNTPIGVCITASSLLQQKTEDFHGSLEASQLTRDMLANYLEVVGNTSAMLLRNLQNTARLIQNFKQAAVDESDVGRRPFLLKVHVEQTLVSLQHHLRDTSHRIAVHGDDALEIESYPGAISQVITSLVMNSLTHAFQKGQAGQMRIDLVRQEKYVLLTYKDDGRGIPSEHHDKIFEPFFTTNRSTGGTGLGLHIVYNLVTHKLKGTIQCESQEGDGATFLITLPLE